MALQKIENGQEAIYKIQAYQLLTDKQMRVFVVKNNDTKNIKEYDCQYEFTKAYVPQGYAHLKKLREFASATDC